MLTSAYTPTSNGQYPWFSSLGARPPLKYLLKPDASLDVSGLSLQGSFHLSYNSMVPLFGPAKKTRSNAKPVWTLCFKDRVDDTDVAVVVKKSASSTTDLWDVHGRDKRAFAAVSDYVKHHMGTLKH